MITYLYGTDGIAGIDVNGSAYYFVKNLQGDVTGILDSNGNTVGTYEYEAYGVITAIKDAQGYNIMYGGGFETSVLQLNPFRYRGYMFDPESEFYYLNSRYYDPWTSRFLNADAFVTTGQGFDGNNMFAYCLNNPVMYKDPAGNRSVEAIQDEIKRVEEQIKLVEWSMANGIGSYNTKYSCNLKRKLNNLNNELAVALKKLAIHKWGHSRLSCISSDLALLFFSLLSLHIKKRPLDAYQTGVFRQTETHGSNCRGSFITFIIIQRPKRLFWRDSFCLSRQRRGT